MTVVNEYVLEKKKKGAIFTNETKSHLIEYVVQVTFVFVRTLTVL